MLALALLCACTAPAQEPVVTETREVDRNLLRKINGRWWTQDNREVYPPGKNGVFWELDSKPGVVEFYHHRPFQLAKAEWLSLFMPADEVIRGLGQPNRIFKMGPTGAFYHYYAANGTVVDVRIMSGVVGEAEYRSLGERKQPVASVQRQLAGRSIYSLMAQRASGKDVYVPMPSVVPAAAPPVTPPRKTIVTPEAAKSIATGDARDALVAKLGEPSFRSAITTDDGVRESLTYHLDNGKTVVFRLLNGKVTQTP